MKTYLPNKKGFTLVELLVVIAILAILAVIGLAVFSGVQKNARDARRREEIDSIAKALEANKVMNNGTYVALATGMFQSGLIPTDTTGNAYCYIQTTTAAAALGADPAPWTGQTCPVAGGWAIIGAGAPSNAAILWKVCASFEATSGVFCKSNQQ
jgi:prepilin-type N-terminal cleavage/methylation domain-containing protein